MEKHREEKLLVFTTTGAKQIYLLGFSNTEPVSAAIGGQNFDKQAKSLSLKPRSMQISCKRERVKDYSAFIELSATEFLMVYPRGLDYGLEQGNQLIVHELANFNTCILQSHKL